MVQLLFYELLKCASGEKMSGQNGPSEKGYILSIEKCNNSKTNGPIHKIQNVLKSSHKDLSDETKITKHFENKIFGVTTLVQRTKCDTNVRNVWLPNRTLNFLICYGQFVLGCPNIYIFLTPPTLGCLIKGGSGQILKICKRGVAE